MKWIYHHIFFKLSRFYNIRIPVNSQNSLCSFSGEWDSGSSISTSPFELKNISEGELISFFCPYSNWNTHFFLPTTVWTHPTTSFLILLIFAFLVISSNYPTFVFTTDPTPSFVLFCLFTLIPSEIVRTGDLMVDLGWESVYIFQYQISSVLLICFCVKINFKKANNKSPKHWEPITPLSANHIAQSFNPHIHWHIRNNPICLKSKMASYVYIYFTFITVINNIKPLVKSHFTAYASV